MSKSIDKAVQKNLIRLRLLKGLSQAELGQLAGLSRSQISKYETGSRLIPAGSLYILAKALEVPLTSFFDGLTLPQFSDKPDMEIDHIGMLDLVSLLKVYSDLPDNEKKSVQGYVRKRAANFSQARKISK